MMKFIQKPRLVSNDVSGLEMWQTAVNNMSESFKDSLDPDCGSCCRTTLLLLRVLAFILGQDRSVSIFPKHSKS